MHFGFMQFLMLAGSLGLLVFGMKLMSEGLQQAAGSRMRRVLETMTRDRLRGVFTGISTTVIVQYSSVVSVMVVSFVNSGLLTLRKAVPVLIGANIGTTLKLLLFVGVGFSALQLPYIALPLMGLALPLLFMRGPRIKATSNLLIGTALLFLALGLLKDNVPPPTADALGFLRSWEGGGILSDLLFVGIGALLAITIQSSSVALVLTVALCEAGTIGYATGAALVLGENIGTTFTANIAALAGNVWAKRAARAHLLIKVLGVAWALVAFKPLLAGIAFFTEQINGSDPHTDASVLKWSLTYLHFAFNLVNGIVLLQFIPWLEKAVTRRAPARNTPDEEFRLEYLEDPMMAVTPELSLMEANKEIAKFGRLCHRMLGMVRELLLETAPQERALLLRRIAKYGSITGRMKNEVGRFLTRTGTETRDEAVSARIRGLLSIIGDLDHAGGILFRMSKGLERKSDERLWFSPEQRQDLLDMMGLVDHAFIVMVRNLEAEGGQVSLDEAMMAEQRIDRQRDRLSHHHLQNIEHEDHNIRTGMAYTELFTSCEKLGDHLVQVSEALAGRI
ncbi:MAG: Na/Pi cotransporter family protein [Flavobacteriales bacterium]|nr:Na/Pi cotransporter family protein [Flavobacteriales bacterium]